MEKVLDLLEIKALFPNEWVLIGNPIFDDSKLEVLSGIPLFHSEDKKASATRILHSPSSRAA